MDIISENNDVYTLTDLLKEMDAHGVTGYRKFELVKKFIQNKAFLSDTPVMGTFELTPRCNLDCKMCYVHLTPEQFKGKKELATSEWISVIDDACDAGMLFAVLTGGECLLHEGFWEIYSHLQSRGVSVTVLTNGLLLNEKNVAKFIEMPPAAIQISLYGSCEEAYENVCGVRTFNVVNNAIDRISDAGIALRIAITPSRYMLSDFENIYRLAISKNADVRVNTMLFPPEKSTGKSIDDFNITVDEYIDLMRLRVEIDGRQCTYECDEVVVGSDNKKQARGIRCTAGRCGYTITWDGQMIPCSNLKIIKQDVFRNGFYTAWNNINEASKNFLLPAECDGCKLSEYCLKCAGVHFCYAGEGKLNPELCKMTESIVKLGIK